MKTQLNDGRELRRGAIPGTQPGAPQSKRETEREERADHKERMQRARGRFKPTPGERVSATGIVRRSGNHNPPPKPKPSSVPTPAPIEEWDNPYLKRKMGKGEALHLAALRKSREQAASDPAYPVDRAAIIRRDDKTCWICKKRLQVKEIELDHVVPLTRGGKHVPENLRVACRSCNAWHGDRLVQPL